MNDITMKLPGQRKEQNFTLYPVNKGAETLTIQSEKAIAVIKISTGVMIYNTKSPYLHNKGVKTGLFSKKELENLKQIAFGKGDTINTGGILISDNSGAIDLTK